MAKKPPPDDLRALARRRLQCFEDLSPEEWAKAVAEARLQGFELLRFPGLVVKIRLLDDP